MLQTELQRENAVVEIITFGSPPARDRFRRLLVDLRINNEDFGRRLVRNELGAQDDNRYNWCGGR